MAARHADILNLIAPVTRGAVDFKESARFDKLDLKRRLGLLYKYAREARRDPDSIGISSLSTTFVSSDQSHGDAMAKRAAENMGLPDAEGARNFPMLLVGTPDQIRREIRSRIEEFNITYFVLSFMSEDSLTLFAKEVMPEFK